MTYTHHPEWVALCRRAAESPDDPLPGMVAADWLDEHGHPFRAMLCREAATWRLFGDSLDLWTKDWGVALFPPKTAGLTIDFVNGFARSVRGKMRDILRVLPILGGDLTTVEHVDVTNRRPLGPIGPSSYFVWSVKLPGRSTLGPIHPPSILPKPIWIRLRPSRGSPNAGYYIWAMYKTREEAFADLSRAVLEHATEEMPCRTGAGS
jgi:uncharacterized protein (TIGR02996 family)